MYTEFVAIPYEKVLTHLVYFERAITLAPCRKLKKLPHVN